MTEKELEHLVTLAGQKAAEKTLQGLGIDVANVHECQADFLHLRKQRLATEQIGKLALRVVLTAFITGLLSALVVGIKAAFK